MTAAGYLRLLAEKIHTVVLATVDAHGNPVTSAIDIMLAGARSVYFLTAAGKSLYHRLETHPVISLTGIHGEDTMHSQSVTLRGRVRNIGTQLLGEIFRRNPYMAEIYPNEESRQALRVFEICEGQGEFFDLSVKPIMREAFSFGLDSAEIEEYRIGDVCTGCGTCLAPCPQSCIELRNGRAHIEQEHCLHCGLCREVCPVDAVSVQRSSV